MSTLSICAIVLNYHDAEKTTQCLLSLVGQGLTIAYVLDNSCTEAQIHEVVERLRAEGIDYTIEIISTGKNLGFGRGVNFVLRHDLNSGASRDFYLLLNNDAVASPGLVESMVREFQKDPDVTLVAPRIVSSSQEREQGIWYHRYLGLLLSSPGRFCFHYFTGCCLLFKRQLAEEHGLFNESFFMYGEDAELGWRLTRLGKKTICALDAFVTHEYGPSVDRASFFYEYHMARGHLLLSCKTWMHPLEIPFLLLFKVIGLAGRAAARCYRYRTLTPICSLLVAWLPLRVDKV
jgi:N-acetylglucosaminyl-diphospho-decaprenol L-rhamnosyltransferase